MTTYSGVPVDDETFIRLEALRLQTRGTDGRALGKGDFIGKILAFVANDVETVNCVFSKKQPLQLAAKGQV